MNNYYTLKHLTDTLNSHLIDHLFRFSISPHKDVWTAYIGDNHAPIRLTFSTHPTETALFLEDYKPPKKNNVTTFFSSLSDKKVTGIQLAENDRFITITFENNLSLYLQLFGNKPNIFLIQNQIILESFKNPDYFEGKSPPLPRPASHINKIVKEGLSPKKTITFINPKFPRHLIPSVIDHYQMDEKNSAEILEIMKPINTALHDHPEFRILTNGNLCLIPQNLLPLENLKIFDDVNNAIRHAYYNTSIERRFNAKLEKIKPAIDKQLRTLESLIEQLKQADKGLERSSRYEQYGHILMANAHIDHPGNSEKITLQDYYNDNQLIDIPIKPTLSLAENAQFYYDKSAKTIRNVEESKRRLSRAKKEIVKLKRLQESLDQIEKLYQIDDWINEHKSALKELGVLTKSESQKSTPYRKIQIDDYEIWIGKNAKSNDKLTTDAHKEDIWMHARGVSGSHLVIRMNNNLEMPPDKILFKAASFAAQNSKARGSDLVPVIITKRKYVTKPKGAPPGTVRVERERVELVRPKNLNE